MLDKRLNDKGKNWRHVLKALKVLDYCLHEGSENVVVWAKDNVYIVKTLREFQYIDEENRDQGLNGEFFPLHASVRWVGGGVGGRGRGLMTACSEGLGEGIDESTAG